MPLSAGRMKVLDDIWLFFGTTLRFFTKSYFAEDA